MFLTLEGIEGSGKSTVLKHLATVLARQHDVLCTREPGDNSLGADLRALLLNPKNTQITPQAELFLYLADRAQHVAECIRPALQQGKWVLCDRYADSTIVYQGYGRGLNPQELFALNNHAIDGLWPDLTLLFDLDPKMGLSRAIARNTQKNNAAREGRFEAETLAFHTRIRDGYLNWAAQNPQRFVRIDASQAPDAVFADVLEVIQRAAAAF